MVKNFNQIKKISFGLFFVLFCLVSPRLLGQYRPILTYDFNLGVSYSHGSSDHFFFEGSKFGRGLNGELLINIPIVDNYFFSGGLGLANMRTMLVYQSDSIRLDYFEQEIDARGLVWETYSGYITVPLLFSMKTDPIKERADAVIGVGITPKKLSRSHMYVKRNNDVLYEDINWIREFNLSFTLRFAFRIKINNNNTFQTQIYYERGLLPLQKTGVPDINYESAGIKLGLNFNFEDKLR